MKDGLVIAIDGPAGAGKTTISKALAKKLNYTYIDTGALYRGFALKALRDGVDIDDDVRVQKMCDEIDLCFREVGGELRLHLGGIDVSKQIREPVMSMKASDISARPIVRKALLGVQRELGKDGGVIFEGRDIGTVVFPDADLKFYLSASVKERARRRYMDFVGAGKRVDMDALINDISQRDKNDSSRKHAPLKQAKDAIYIDSTEYSIDEVVELMITEVNKKL